MNTKFLGIGLIAILAVALISVIPVSANSPAHQGDFNGDGQLTFADVCTLWMCGKDDMGHPGHAPFVGTLYDNPDVNQDGVFSTADVYLLWAYYEWYPYQPNPYTIYPRTTYTTKYPVFEGEGYYYRCQFSTKYPGCSAVSSWLGYVTCDRYAFYDQTTGPYTA